ncbi:MAG: hypothetical protein K9J13_15015, partial [Saprospiraceae bacterium]|nr:hypothetical protein [Saprospiraceae bacterium]
MQSNHNNSQIMARTSGDSLLQLKIFNFINRMNLVRENPEYEGSENWNYSRDSTVWYIEAALNYVSTYNYRYYGEEDESFISILDSTETEIDGEGGEFNIVDIQETYDYLSDYLSDYYDEIDAEDKFFKLIDIISISGNDISTRFVFGVIQAAYNLGDWYWGWGLGRCSGGCYGTDAADILEAAVNGLYPLQYGQHLEFSYTTTILSEVNFTYPADVPTTPHAYGNYMLFKDCQYPPIVNHCLDATEMGIFLNFLPDIAYHNQPTLNPIHYEVVDDISLGMWTDMVHTTRISYGTVHSGIGSPPTL